jgi:hypothetical protein
VVVDVGTVVVVVVDVVVVVVVEVEVEVVVDAIVVVVVGGTGTEQAVTKAEVAIAELSISGDSARTATAVIVRIEPRRSTVDERGFTQPNLLARPCESTSGQRRDQTRTQENEVAKATTRFEVGTSNKPSPRPGVGKWLAATPTATRRRTAPVAGSSP